MSCWGPLYIVLFTSNYTLRFLCKWDNFFSVFMHIRFLDPSCWDGIAIICSDILIKRMASYCLFKEYISLIKSVKFKHAGKKFFKVHTIYSQINLRNCRSLLFNFSIRKNEKTIRYRNVNLEWLRNDLKFHQNFESSRIKAWKLWGPSYQAFCQI